MKPWDSVPRRRRQDHNRHNPRGEFGFGYDPVFVVDGMGSLTMAELDPDTKNRISHRARALEAARPILAGLLGA